MGSSEVPLAELCQPGYELRDEFQCTADNPAPCGVTVICNESAQKYSLNIPNVTRESELPTRGTCLKREDCSSSNLKWKEMFGRNKIEMYNIDVPIRVKHSEVMNVQCKYDGNKWANLKCHRGQVLPNYECPEMDQTKCPKMNTRGLQKLLFVHRLDRSHGCVE